MHLPPFLLAVPLVLATSDLNLDTDAIDAVFRAYDRVDGPGVALGIVHEGELVHARGYGMANLEHDIPLAPDSVLRIGSTSKQFTAACAALAEQAGLLRLDQDIREILPEMPDYGTPITIRQLLHHTSGVRDYLQLMALAGHGDHDHYTNADVYRMIARQERLNFTPGTQHLYSNSGYFLISVIIERVSGQTLARFAEKHLFGPLGMTSTHFHDDHTRVVARRADGYTAGADGEWRISNTTLEMCGDGGVFTTVEDMLLWDANFYEPKVGGQALLNALHARGVLDDGTELDYALGLVHGEHRGLRTVSHGGAFVGFRAETIRFPDERLSVICFANVDSCNPSALATQVADVVLAERFEAAGTAPASARSSTPPAAGSRPAPSFTTLAPAALAGFAGRYLDEIDGELIEVAPQGDGLRFTAGRLSVSVRPTSERDFATSSGGASARFDERDGNGFWRGLLRLDDRALPFRGYVAWDAEYMSLEDYVGDYESPELDAQWSVGLLDGELVVALDEDGPLALSMLALDVARSGPLGLVVFERDAFHGVTGFRLSSGRVLGLRFERRSD